MSVDNNHEEESLVGRLVDTVSFAVEQGKIQEFYRACQLHDPVHISPQVAAERGLERVPATATHVVVAGHQREPRSILASFGIDFTRVVVGGASWDYVRPALEGDELTGRRMVSSDVRRRNRKGQQLRFLEFETEFTDAEGRLVLRQRETLIERGHEGAK